MSKYIYGFYFLGIALFILSLFNFATSIMMTLSFASRGTEDVTIWQLIHYITSSAHALIYPLVLAVICLFFARLAKLFGGPNVDENVTNFIKNLRSAGNTHD